MTDIAAPSPLTLIKPLFFALDLRSKFVTIQMYLSFDGLDQFGGCDVISTVFFITCLNICMRRMRFFFFEEHTLLLQITTGYNLEDDRCECVALQDYKKNEQVKPDSRSSVHPGRDNTEQQQVHPSFPHCSLRAEDQTYMLVVMVSGDIGSSSSSRHLPSALSFSMLSLVS